MRAGRLIETVDIERNTPTLDQAGVPVESWAVIDTVRVQIRIQSIEESQQQFGASTDETVTFRTHYISDLTLADRLVWNGQPYNIKSIVPLDDHRLAMEIKATKIG